jgi:hypothetical protein
MFSSIVNATNFIPSFNNPSIDTTIIKQQATVITNKIATKDEEIEPLIIAKTEKTNGFQVFSWLFFLFSILSGLLLMINSSEPDDGFGFKALITALLLISTLINAFLGILLRLITKFIKTKK